MFHFRCDNSSELKWLIVAMTIYLHTLIKILTDSWTHALNFSRLQKVGFDPIGVGGRRFELRTFARKSHEVLPLPVNVAVDRVSYLCIILIEIHVWLC